MFSMGAFDNGLGWGPRGSGNRGISDLRILISSLSVLLHERFGVSIKIHIMSDFVDRGIMAMVLG